jgi:glutaredoxin
MLNAPELANFFEQRSTEYNRASTTGTWDEAFASMEYYDVYGQAGCSQCQVAKHLLDKHGYEYTYHDLTGDAGTKEDLMECTGARSMPMIFKDGDFLGSVFDLKAHLESLHPNL